MITALAGYEYDDGCIEYDDGYIDYDDGYIDYDDGYTEYDYDTHSQEQHNPAIIDTITPRFNFQLSLSIPSRTLVLDASYT
ncbi:hypothetical protein P153DRAFT_370104 [Dothidotthia symphoricarpi CBS 119687]|uniref:Uncharacterized protein n=1 Tax=Dothidotthia symphoricarpi CBS 119687 TaxID=1392245 RepID=A0A6A6A2Q1_9PLEO|nr:uncharacterized protein P153DRAFT_370104 [Dothidotthia symphoricarpi CBS 119687]KAF2125444.1 hypothetical protein P153DRAFT_370104 [Dothidotthia symphoricarpi CBS 119687]